MVTIKKQLMQALMNDIQSFDGNISTEEVELILSSQIIDFKTITKRSPDPESEFDALMDKINRTK